MSSYHEPVMKHEIVNNLEKKNNAVYVDVTLGMGGHTLAIMGSEKKPKKMICIDLDEESLSIAEKNLSKYSNDISYIRGNFKDIDKLINEKVDVIIADLGISSYQLLHSSRGFSFDEESVLDMRIDKKQPLTAHRIVNNYNIEDLSDVIKNFGEEKNHFKIASAIVRHRSREEIKTCLDLATIIRKTNKSVSKIDAATRTFQALSLEVNGELTSLEAFLSKSWSVLKEGGKLIVISFHSLEDRIVKQFFKNAESDCVCPKTVMICECNKIKTFRTLTKKPLVPSKEEISFNKRARSAKMRIGEAI